MSLRLRRAGGMSLWFFFNCGVRHGGKLSWVGFLIIWWEALVECRADTLFSRIPIPSRQVECPRQAGFLFGLTVAHRATGPGYGEEQSWQRSSNYRAQIARNLSRCRKRSLEKRSDAN